MISDTTGISQCANTRRPRGARLSVRTICRILAAFFFAAALLWWVYSPGVDCDPLLEGGCGFFDLGIGYNLGLIVNFGILVLLAITGVSLWPAVNKQD